MRHPPRQGSWLRSCALLAVLLLAVPAQASENALKDHPSPYLALHGQDPVHWQDLTPDSVAAARRDNKPLFVSSGYFSCHWCHVMQRESWRDADIARLLNTHFIPVKMDRELQPALDAWLIRFVERTQGQAGWPLNVILTPEGHPLLGFTYRPADEVRRALSRFAHGWPARQGELKALARQAQAELEATQTTPAAPLALSAAQWRERLAQESLELADTLSGGFGGPNKFPHAAQLLALLEIQAQAPQPALEAFLRLTLDQMAWRGLRDHLGGGFFRYTVDPGWETPHFEKMLYDNALLARLYLRAGAVLRTPDYTAVARDTLDFLLAAMRDGSGLFIASLSAVDSQDVEGGHYLWSVEELRQALNTEQYALAEKLWRLQQAPTLETGHHLFPGAAPAISARRVGLDAATFKARLAEINARLLPLRARRALPADRKLIAAWNGLALQAFADAAAQLKEPRYHTAAQQLQTALRRQLLRPQGLLRAQAGGRPAGSAGLEDYAALAAGLAAYARLSGVAADTRAAAEITTQGLRRFHTARGWRASEQPLLPGAPPEPALADEALPAASALLLAAARNLPESALDAASRETASTAIQQAAASAYEHPFSYASHALLLAQPAISQSPTDKPRPER